MYPLSQLSQDHRAPVRIDCGSAAAPCIAAERTSFNVAWSIYVGWMPWDFADQSGILKKWADKYGIKIKLTQINDYVESINQYTAGGFDACVMTNMDMLTIPAAGGVDSTALIVGRLFQRQRWSRAQGQGQTACRHQGTEGQSGGTLGLALPAGSRARQHRIARARHQDRQHLGCGYRRRILPHRRPPRWLPGSLS